MPKRDENARKVFENYLFILLFAVFIEVISNFFTSIHLSRISLLS